MKKFLIVVMIGILGYFFIDYLIFYQGSLYVPKDEQVQTVSMVQEDQIMLTENGEEAPFEIKGVTVSSFLPGHTSLESAVTKETYIRWFAQIQELGANTLRISTLAAPVFYESLYEYNQSAQEPLYVMQGIHVSDELQNSYWNAFHKKIVKNLQKNGRNMINAVHGQYKVKTTQSLRAWHYKHDISKWVIGYFIGDEWNEDLINYTDENTYQRAQYEGTYLSTKDASNFEIFLAENTDRLIAYETEKYGMQRVIAFPNQAMTDPFTYDENMTRVLRKYTSMDVEHIVCEEAFAAGQIAAYAVYPYYPEYDAGVTDNAYRSYLEKLQQHHTMPVIVSEFGISSSRAKSAYEQNRTLKRDQGGLNEQEQGEAIVSLYQDIQAVGMKGAILNAWQEDWQRKSWSTLSSVDTTRIVYWRDVQTTEQGFGLLSFDTGESRSIVYVDGDDEEWKKQHIVCEDDAYTLSMQYDEAYLYFKVEAKNGNVLDTPIYIPLDITPKSGSKAVESLSLNTSEETDYVIVLDGTENSRVWVQDRYDELMALYGNVVKPYYTLFTDIPKKKSSNFVKMYTRLYEDDYYYLGNKISAADYDFDNPSGHYILSQLYETGRLQMGNGNPNAEDYNSLADYCVKEDVLELRIPWQLVSFIDPSMMKVHDDYYTHYGVEGISINHINVGVGDGSEQIKMQSFSLKGWKNKVIYHERLKKSYDILKEEWGKDGGSQ